MDKNLLSAILWGLATLLASTLIFCFTNSKYTDTATMLVWLCGYLTAYYKYDTYKESKIKRWEK